MVLPSMPLSEKSTISLGLLISVLALTGAFSVGAIWKAATLTEKVASIDQRLVRIEQKLDTMVAIRQTAAKSP